MLKRSIAPPNGLNRDLELSHMNAKELLQIKECETT